MPGPERVTDFDTGIAIERVEAIELAAPLSVPRRNAFGTMRARPALLVRLADRNGYIGWGEAFCNWPFFGSRHRARIIRDLIAPVIEGVAFEGPDHLGSHLADTFRALSIQANEPGPFEQSYAALDIAAWDLIARRAERPLWSLINPDQGGPAPRVYASALTTEAVPKLVPPLLDTGWEGFKLKVGFGLTADRSSVEALRALIGPQVLMVDANQNWSFETALETDAAIAPLDIAWMEEPISALAAPESWMSLAQHAQIPLAAGENLRGIAAFEDAARHLAVLQPDVIKWGGLSGLLEVTAAAKAAGRAVCPHYLGGGVGLNVTVHAAYALGAPWVEMDVTENALRGSLGTGFAVIDGRAVPSNDPGSGSPPTSETLAAYAV